jgi:hypothetical protein
MFRAFNMGVGLVIVCAARAQPIVNMLSMGGQELLPPAAASRRSVGPRLVPYRATPIPPSCS